MPRAERLTMYGSPSGEPPLVWDWVDDQLTGAAVYWVVAGSRRPHPRPVWGVWRDEALHLSIGSPAIQRAIEEAPEVSVHLGGDVDVVIVEGTVVGHSDEGAVVADYDRKYDWDYDVDRYGPFVVVRPAKVIAWRSAGWAGRDGFRQTGRWRFDDLG